MSDLAQVVFVTPADDRFVVWVCPTHGIVDDGELAEGVDWSAGTSIHDGDVAWTDRFYCQRDHADDQGHEVVMVDVRGPILAAVSQGTTP